MAMKGWGFVLVREEELLKSAEEKRGFIDRITELEKLRDEQAAEIARQQQYFDTQTRYFETMMSDENDLTLRLPGEDTISDVVNKTFQGLNEKITNIVYRMAETAESSGALDKAIGQLNNHYNVQLDLIKEITQANEELAKQSQIISEMAGELDFVASENSEAADKGKEVLASNQEIFAGLDLQVSETASFMNELAGSIDAVLKSTELITNLAEQLKLLALNASIEAARAGEAGVGFGVVANYMKELSDETSQSTRQVIQVMGALFQRKERMEIALQKNQEMVREGYALFNSGMEKFQTITRGIKNLKEKTEVIALSLKSQSENTSQISASTEQALSFSEEVLLLNRETGAHAENLNGIVAGVLHEIGSFKLDLHKRVLNSLEDVKTMLPRRPDWDVCQNIIENFLRSGSSCFELIYAMDERGTQRIDNMANPNCKERVTSGAKGKNWSQKDYFQKAVKGCSYVSNIYISSATGNLCITASLPLLREDGSIFGVLAGDIDLHEKVFVRNA